MPKPPPRRTQRRAAGRSPTSADVRILAKSTPFKGYFRINRYRLTHRLFAGGWSAPLTREVFERGHAAGVLLYDPDRDVVVLIEQFRIGAFSSKPPFRVRPVSPWLMEVVAGIVEPGENPKAVARREALEETGCAIRDLVRVCNYLATPGGSTESVILYCGRVRAPLNRSIHGLAAESEDIRVHVVPAAQAIRWLESGKACNSMIVIALQWFALNRGRLRKRWRRA